jgi:hypothetical protein
VTAGSDRGRDSRAGPVGADGSGGNGGKICSNVTEELIEGWWVRGRDSGEAGLVRTRTPWTFETNQINAEPTLSEPQGPASCTWVFASPCRFQLYRRLGPGSLTSPPNSLLQYLAFLVSPPYAAATSYPHGVLCAALHIPHSPAHTQPP